MKKSTKIYVKCQEFIKYTLAGAVTVAVALISYYICVLTFLNPEHPIELQIANIISWLLANTFSYFSNSRFVFRSKQKNKLKQAWKFLVSRILTLILDMLLMFLGVTAFGFNDKITKVISQIIVILTNYITSKKFVFKKRKKK